MLNIGPPELILIFVIALVIVGPQRLPELARTVGKGLREFRRMQDEVKDLVNTGMGDEFKETAAELKRTATDLKSATDVRSAFREDSVRTRPHRPKGEATRVDPVSPTPEPDSEVPAPEPEADTTNPASAVDADDGGTEE
jgi:sec-independent protein translocase protein TatB